MRNFEANKGETTSALVFWTWVGAILLSPIWIVVLAFMIGSGLFRRFLSLMTGRKTWMT